MELSLRRLGIITYRQSTIRALWRRTIDIFDLFYLLLPVFTMVVKLLLRLRFCKVAWSSDSGLKLDHFAAGFLQVTQCPGLSSVKQAGTASGHLGLLLGNTSQPILSQHMMLWLVSRPVVYLNQSRLRTISRKCQLGDFIVAICFCIAVELQSGVLTPPS